MMRPELTAQDLIYVNDEMNISDFLSEIEIPLLVLR